MNFEPPVKDITLQYISEQRRFTVERITAIFESVESANCAMDKLRSVGITDATLTTVKSSKVMSILQQDVSSGCSRGIMLGTVLGVIGGLVLALWTSVGPLLFSGWIGTSLTALLGAVMGGVVGSLIGTAYDLKCKTHQEAVQATSEHEGKLMIAVDAHTPEDVLKVQDLMKTLGGELVTTLLPVTAPPPPQLLH